jgi:hypothetical protein
MTAVSRTGLRTKAPSMLARQASTMLAIGALLAFWLALVAHV